MLINMEIKEQIKHINYLRMKPEERFLYDILIQLKPKYSNRFPFSTYYCLNKKIMFEYNSKLNVLFVDSYNIWIVFLKTYHLSLIDVEKLISKYVTNMLNINITNTILLPTNKEIWHTLKLKNK